jgi:hypothetical protein
MSDAVDDVVTRTVAIVGLAGIALIHVLQAPEAFEETTYLGILFVGAIVASLAIAALLTRTSDARVWAAAAGLPALILLGYVLSRTSGLPDATLDVGEWTEPLGLASLVAEGLVVFVAGGVVATRSGESAPRRSETRRRPVFGGRSGPAARAGS